MESIFVDGVERLIRAPVDKLLRQACLSFEGAPSISGRRLTLTKTNRSPDGRHQPSSDGTAIAARDDCFSLSGHKLAK
jgi:hypothetical protein